MIEALRKSHPYEEPAFDLNQLAAPPQGIGIGRIAEFDLPVERGELFERIKRGLEIDRLLIAGPMEGTVQSGRGLCRGMWGVAGQGNRAEGRVVSHGGNAAS